MQQFGVDVQSQALCSLANLCVSLPNSKPAGEKEEARVLRDTPPTAVGIFDFRVRTGMHCPPWRWGLFASMACCRAVLPS